MTGKSQIYGTQLQGSGKEMHYFPIKDAEHVDERRANVGLETFAEMKLDSEHYVKLSHKLSL